ncbi:MAG: DNA-directed DNA polymerase II small subunit [Promethearchaeota archaeon]
MNSYLDEKKAVVSKLANMGINITPKILDFVMKFESPSEKVNSIIIEASFNPKFENHLTYEIMQSISEKEIQKALERHVNDSIKVKEKIHKSKKRISTKNPTNIELKKVDDIKISETLGFKTVKTQSELQGISNNTDPIGANSGRKQKAKYFGATKPKIEFKPIARDYDFDYRIVKDPTGKIHSSGEYDEFYNLTLDKFEKLNRLIKKRPEAISSTTITNVLRNTKDQQISITGLVNEFRETKKGNWFLTLEDNTGTINVILRKDNDDPENRKIIERLIQDQMVLIEGIYNPGNQNNNGIIFADVIRKIDIPNNFEPKYSSDPLSIAFISDLHIGSKEFEQKLWDRFIDFLNGNIDDQNLRTIAGKIKYIIINGDLVDGIGIYPQQENDLVIKDIYKQFKKASNLLSQIPDYIQIFFSSGNHDPVRNAIPRPAVSKKYAQDLIDIGIKCVGNPSIIQTHNVSTLAYHGDSMLDMNLLVSGLENEKPTETMKEFLICRHLAPIFGKRTQIAPTSNDWLVIDTIPDIFHTGHIHINGLDKYKNISLVNSGCFQAQTDFMKSFGIVPTPGRVPIIELDTYKSIELDFSRN